MNRSFRHARRGLTLVEMLVATAVTLLLVAALSQAFALVGTTVARQRTSVGMSGRMRSITSRLERDLDGITVPVRPWDGTELGYFEYVEGPSHDTRLLDVSSPPGSQFGDADDVLMFTSRSPVDSPFIGAFQGTILKSELAEVVWWATLNESPGGNLVLNGDRTPDPELGPREDYTIYRRALLIIPELNSDTSTHTEPIVGRLPTGPLVSGISSGQTPPYDVSNQSQLKQLESDIKDFISKNDISVRFVPDPSGNPPGQNINVYVIANSLQDLSHRRNRFAHFPLVRQSSPGSNNLSYVAETSTGSGFPYGLDRDDSRDSVTRLPKRRVLDYSSANSSTAFPGVIKRNDQRGEDVMLSGAAAFDVRVFDPSAPVAAHPGDNGTWGNNGNVGDAGAEGSDDLAVFPGDPGFAQAGTTGTAARSNGGSTTHSYVQIGQGAFVDLGYSDKVFLELGSTNNTYNEMQTTSDFSDRPLHVVNNNNNVHIEVIDDVQNISNRSWTYDTWSFLYEQDGINQDGDQWDNDNNGSMDVDAIDEGNDGIDNDYRNGVDDYGERETVPPYSAALRGIQVRVRLFDFDTRQVQQMTVEASFTQ